MSRPRVLSSSRQSFLGRVRQPTCQVSLYPSIFLLVREGIDMKQFYCRRLHRRSERGQSMVEMALMMTILLVVLSAVIDLGRGFFSFIAIQNAAAEGALYAAINPRCRNATVTGCGDPNN